MNSRKVKILISGEDIGNYNIAAKLENELYTLVSTCAEALSDNPLFFLVNSYTTGFQPAVLQNIIGRTVQSRFGGKVDAQEVVLPVRAGGVLPCGASGRWQKD